MKNKANWVPRGRFDCTTGVTSGMPFSVDSDIMAGITEYAANSGCSAVFRHDVRLDNSERRLTIVLSMPE